VWWVFFSRAWWSERLGAIVLMIVAMVATRLIIHESIAGGMMGMMFPIYGIISMCIALVVGLVAYAVATEVIQQTVLPDRQGDWTDVVADLVGAAVGLLATRSWRTRERAR